MKKRSYILMLAAAMIMASTGCTSEANIVEETTSISGTNNTTISNETTLTEENLTIESTTEPIADGITEATGLEKIALEAIEIGDYNKLAQTAKNKSANVTDTEVSNYIANETANIYIPEKIMDKVIDENSIANICITVETNSNEVLYQVDAISYNMNGTGFFEEIKEHLTGLKPGEETTIDSKYAGKEVDITVKINYIEGNLINAEYGTDFIFYTTNGKCSTKKEYEEYIRNIIQEEKKAEIKTTLVNDIISNSRFNDKLLEEYINNSYEEGIKFYEKYATDYGYTNMNELALAIDYTPDELKEKIKETAENNVKKTVVFTEIISKENLEITTDDINKMTQAVLNSYGYKSVEEYLTSNTTEDLRYEVLGNIALNYIMGE